jgi:hypothetical protein
VQRAARVPKDGEDVLTAATTIARPLFVPDAGEGDGRRLVFGRLNQQCWRL